MRLTFTSTLPVPREPLFAFHTHPENLGLLLAGWKSTRLLSTEGHIRPGARTEIEERLGPFRLRLVFEHQVLEPPERFAERLVTGPFRLFEHEHVFRETGPETTVLEDRIQVELSFALGGELATRHFLRPRLQRFFEFRRRAYQRLAAEGRLG